MNTLLAAQSDGAKLSPLQSANLPQMLLLNQIAKPMAQAALDPFSSRVRGSEVSPAGAHSTGGEARHDRDARRDRQPARNHRAPRCGARAPEGGGRNRLAAAEGTPMSTAFAERPHFFEGQYLGADDLEVLLGYLRDQAARHLLGPHTVGIVAGIDLASRLDAAGATEYFLTPGIAHRRLWPADRGPRSLQARRRPVRAAADRARQRLDPLRRGIGRRRATRLRSLRRRRCLCARHRIVRGRDRFAQHDRAAPSGRLRRATSRSPTRARRSATTWPAGSTPIACDASVVGAALSAEPDDPDLWLIPLGRVPWTQGAPGSFGATSEIVEKQSMLFRRQAGIVAESIIAANGLLRLRARWLDRVAGQTDRPALPGESAAGEGPRAMQRPRATARADLARRAHALSRRRPPVRNSRRMAGAGAARITSAGGMRSRCAGAPTRTSRTARTCRCCSAARGVVRRVSCIGAVAGQGPIRARSSSISRRA